MSRTVSKGSEYVFNLYCQPCDGVGYHIEANGYCQQCREHLCEVCCKYHCRQRPSRDHQLLDSTQMPLEMTKVFIADDKSGEPLSQNDEGRRCLDHNSKRIKYFCKDHEKLCCTVCVSLHHRVCRSLVCISDIAEGLSESDEYKYLKQEIETMKVEVKRTGLKIQESKQRIGYRRSRARSDIKEAHTRAMKRIDKMKETAKQEVDAISDKDMKVINKAEQNCEALKSEVECLSADIDQANNFHAHEDLFISIIKAKDKLPDLSSALEKIHLTEKITNYSFDADSRFRTAMDGVPMTGNVVPIPDVKDDYEAVYVADIDVQRKAKRSGLCRVTGIAVLPDNQLVICDHNNGMVKVIDMLRNDITSETRLVSKPWGITTTSNGDIVITQPGIEKLHFFKLKNKALFDTGKKLDVGGKCFGIISFDRKFIVSFVYDRNIAVLSESGEVISRISIDASGPVYFTLTPCHRNLFVSNHNSNTVSKLRLSDGKVMAKYADADLRFPQGVTMDNYGHVFACSNLPYSVHMFTQDCRKIQIILREKDGITCPDCVIFREKTRELLVAMTGLNKIVRYVVEAK